MKTPLRVTTEELLLLRAELQTKKDNYIYASNLYAHHLSSTNSKDTPEYLLKKRKAEHELVEARERLVKYEHAAGVVSYHLNCNECGESLHQLTMWHIGDNVFLCRACKEQEGPR